MSQSEQALGPETGGASGSSVAPDINIDILQQPLSHTRSEQSHSQAELNRFARNVDVNPRSYLNYPTIGRPVSDYNTIGLLSKAFPCLFPYGSGDVSCRDRIQFISEAIAAKHYVKYCINLRSACDKIAQANPSLPVECLDHIYHPSKHPSEWYYPFVSHERFPHWMQNLVERHRANGQRNFWLGRNDKFANLTNDELLEMINRRGESYHELLGSMQSFNANINGSPQYLFGKRKLLETLIDQKGMPTMWFTLSMADNHWKDLHSMLHRNADGRPVPFPDFDGDVQAEASWKRRTVRDNPHIVDQYFYMRVQALFRTMFSRFGIETEWLWFRIEYQSRGAPHAHGCLKVKADPGLTKLAATVVKGRVAGRMLSERDLTLPGIVNPQNIELDIWQPRDTSALEHLEPADTAKLFDEVKEGAQAEARIVSFHDFFLSSHHVNPPSDASSSARCPSTNFDPKTTTVPHPSSVDISSVLGSDENRNIWFSHSLNAQYRHCHQKYCDRNHDRRGQARAHVDNGTLGARSQRPEDIPVDCRFRFPKPERSNSHVVVEEKVMRDKTITYRASMAPKCNNV